MHRSGLPVVALISLALVVGACGGSSQPPAEQAPVSSSALAAHMAEHFARVREVEEAVIRGDIAAAQAPARWIADHEEAAGLPPGSDAFVSEMKNAADAVASSTEIGQAAVATASMVSICGRCHAGAGVIPSLPAVSAPEAAAGTPGHMRQHQYAVDLMYRGLIQPSDELWRKGAETLRASPLAEKELPDLMDEIALFEARVHELADRATQALDRGAKVAIYGEIISGCANCHGSHGKVWGPGVPKIQ